MIITLTVDNGEATIFNILGHWNIIEDGSQDWKGNADNIDYWATDRDDCMIAIVKFSDGMIAHIYVLLAPVDGVDNMTISFQ